MREKLHNFFQNPTTFWAKFVEVVIMVLIVVSVAIVGTEFFYPEIFKQFYTPFIIIEHIALVVFTIEYVLRVFTAPRILRFAARPMSIVDFLAVFPNYLEFFLAIFPNTTAIRAVRIIRLFRFLRILKFFRYKSFFGRIFRYQNTILERITPVLIFFMALKGAIWLLEVKGWWISRAELGELFAIIGFALGIILSQKIGVSYDKFIQVEEAIVRVYSKLTSLSTLLERKNKGGGSGEACRTWGKSFLDLLQNESDDHAAFFQESHNLYEKIAEVEPNPSELAILYTDLESDASFALSKKHRLTPKAYDTLLNQATVLYLALVAVFIPAGTGMISVIVATYVLYGMYRLTQDLDSIFGGEFNLINIDVSELKRFVGNV
ncbi:MAG: ion transporter [Patescibacteria group bacterium]|nr:ion transporter [Patescibacteria group bacterium]